LHSVHWKVTIKMAATLRRGNKNHYCDDGAANAKWQLP
jgi:hypothetical protein